MARILVTGSAGHLGEALMRTLATAGRGAVGLDCAPSPFTTHVGSICDRRCVRACLRDAHVVLHTATLHKPHVATHGDREFVETNVTGTLVLLEEAAAAGVEAFVFSSTTSSFGSALRPPDGEPAVWVTEATAPVPRNIYGTTKLAAELLCELFQRRDGLPCIVLRTSRFFPEQDDDPAVGERYPLANVQANELVYRRVDIEDVVGAHLLAAEKAGDIGFGRYIVSATTPFEPSDLPALRHSLPEVVRRLYPDYEPLYRDRGWRMFPGIDRVYDNARARTELGWRPHYDFRHVVDSLRLSEDFRSTLARQIGYKGYHPVTSDPHPRSPSTTSPPTA